MFKPRYARVRPAPDAPVQVQLQGPGLLEIVHARDVSRSGFGLRIAEGLPPCALDGEVELIVTLPGRSPFRARGDVRHTTEGLDQAFLGVEIVEIREAHRALLEAYVSERLRAEHGV